MEKGRIKCHLQSSKAEFQTWKGESNPPPETVARRRPEETPENEELSRRKRKENEYEIQDTPMTILPLLLYLFILRQNDINSKRLYSSNQCYKSRTGFFLKYQKKEAGLEGVGEGFGS